MLKSKLVSLLFFLFAIAAIAQDSFDTSILLNEISINTYRFDQFSDGSKQQKIDSSSKANHFASNVAEALNSLTSLHLKSYGISGNTSISLRGTSSAHTAILWNGINLQDPLNGGTNLELIPLQAIDEIVVQYGGSGALYGSGAIGGAILMQSKAQFQAGLKTAVGAGIGSYGNYFGQASIQKGGEKVAVSLKLFYRQAENDFPFVNTQQFGHPEMTQSNAAVEYFGISQDSRFLLAENQQINTHLWIQKSTRELPPNMTMLVSKQVQTDEAIRFSTDYTLSKPKYDIMARAGLLSSKLNFNDSLSGIYAEHLSRSAILETEVNYKTRTNHLLNFGIHERIDWGESDNYAKISHRNNLAFLLSYKLWNSAKTLHISGSIRQELIDKNFSQPTPALGLTYEIGEHFQLSGKVSRNYRQPTFNDLFWQGGFAKGNPDLLDESAWSQDIGVQFHKFINRNNISLSLSTFNTYIKNLILWIPIEGIWTPLNQKEVWSRGIETDLRLDRTIHKLKIKLELHYSFNPSTLEKTAENESESILKKQLIYTPKNQAKALFSLVHPIGSLTIEQLFVGKRYTIADNTSWLDAYPLTNLILSSSIKKEKQNLGLSFRLNNLFNQDYQSMENYALPGRNYQISIHYNIN
ncbi:MAG: TonB-dependent receptor [Bacteroidales bacterium]|jgi:vitamin B12 transporter|nr:TonB-dependent receptor [Bacteroidales bacterium]